MRKKRHGKSNEESSPRPRTPQLAITNASGSENPSTSSAKRATRRSKSIESANNMLSPSLLEESPKKGRKSDSKNSPGGRSPRDGVPLCKQVRRKSEVATSNASSFNLAGGSEITPSTSISPTSTVTANEQTMTYTYSTSTIICNLPNAADFMKINLRGVKCDCNAPNRAVLSSIEDYVKHCIQYHQPSVVVSHSELTQYCSPEISSTKQPSKYSSVLRTNCLLDNCNVPENVDAAVIRLKPKPSIVLPDDSCEPLENSGEEYSPPLQQTPSFDEYDNLIFGIPSPSPPPHLAVCCASNDEVDDHATEVEYGESLKNLSSISPVKKKTLMEDDMEIPIIDLTGVDEVLLHEVCDNFSFTIPTIEKENVEQKLKEEISDYEEAYEILESNSDKLTRHATVNLDYLDSNVFFDALARYHIKNFEYLQRQEVSFVPASTPMKVRSTTPINRAPKKKHLSENKGKPLKTNLSACGSAPPKGTKRSSDSATRAERAKRRRTLGPVWSIPYVHDTNIPITILENIWHLPKTGKSLHNLEANNSILPSSQTNRIATTSQETTTVVGLELGKEIQAEKNKEWTLYGGPPSILSNPFTIDDWEGLSDEEDFLVVASALTPRILHNMGTKMAMADILEDEDSP